MCISNFNKGTPQGADTWRLIRRWKDGTKMIPRETDCEERRWKRIQIMSNGRK
jgi:hypothetical protein